MKRFLQSLTAVLKTTKEAKLAACSQRPNPTPLLEVSSQVKAGGLDRNSGGIWRN